MSYARSLSIHAYSCMMLPCLFMHDATLLSDLISDQNSVCDERDWLQRCHQMIRLISRWGPLSLTLRWAVLGLSFGCSATCYLFNPLGCGCFMISWLVSPTDCRVEDSRGLPEVFCINHIQSCHSLCSVRNIFSSVAMCRLSNAVAV